MFDGFSKDFDKVCFQRDLFPQKFALLRQDFVKILMEADLGYFIVDLSQIWDACPIHIRQKFDRSAMGVRIRRFPGGDTSSETLRCLCHSVDKIVQAADLVDVRWILDRCSIDVRSIFNRCLIGVRSMFNRCLLDVR